MQSLIHLKKATAPVYLLTATLVPRHEPILAKKIGISLPRTLVLRSPTARPNHRLQMIPLALLDTPSSVGFQLASLLLEKWEGDATVRGIIFIRSRKKLDAIVKSATFPVCTYHGKMTDREKETQLSSWFSNEHPAKWMVSTTALLHGVDYPRVDAVIFLESPFGLYDFVQGAGRAGRSGQESLIVVFYNELPPELPDENPHGCRAEMGSVLVTPACRRISISKVMDGNELSCSEPGSLLCDFCEGDVDPLITKAIEVAAPTSIHATAPVPVSIQTTAPAPVSIQTTAPAPVSIQTTAPASASIQTTAPVQDYVPPPGPPPTAVLTGFAAQFNGTARKQHGEAIKDLMERFGGCFVCRIASDDHSPCHDECGNSGASGCMLRPHRPYTCVRYSHRNGWMDWKKGFLWPSDVSRCYFCGFPSTVVSRDHRGTDSTKYPGICRYSDTAVVAAWHILHTPDLFDKLRRELGFVPGVDPRASFAAWLNVYESDSQEIRLLSVFSWLCRQYYPDYFHSS